MADTLIIMSGLTQDVDGPTTYFYPLFNETLTITLTGTVSGGNAIVEVLDSVETAWSLAASVNDGAPTATFTVTNPNAVAIRARLVGSVTPNATIQVGIAP
jgi:hypothetical protein